MFQMGGPNNVPIIGQPTIVDWAVSVVVKCAAPCEGTVLVTGKLGAACVCGQCKRAYVVGSLQFSDAGDLGVGLGVRQLK